MGSPGAASLLRRTLRPVASGSERPFLSETFYRFCFIIEWTLKRLAAPLK